MMFWIVLFTKRQTTHFELNHLLLLQDEFNSSSVNVGVAFSQIDVNYSLSADNFQRKVYNLRARLAAVVAQSFVKLKYSVITFDV